ncbi:hypothetical protein [Stenomitos frigidus]|uniref:Uncharacterized protein n=1 Tax=Stenomitos frigidus ULC18 TaxID=2107698 RepID=A0A2T1E0I1_9CYAN|nr:hypothetical protein [Stenomitos frigidus]PSB26191.1 hypothetical protein C7B82_20440 [Stenomitos frigidus ULC18]
MDTQPVWSLQPGEPEKWFARFERYRLQGEGRSLEAVYRSEIAADRNRSQRSQRPSSQWYVISKQWRWLERATAWDLAESKQDESLLRSARVELVQRQVASENEWLTRQQRLREQAQIAFEDYLFGRVTEVRQMEKQKDALGTEGEIHKLIEESTVTITKHTPQWAIERVLGKHDHEKHLTALYGLTQQIMRLEGDSDDLRQIKALIQATLEGLLLEVGAAEMRAVMALT